MFGTVLHQLNQRYQLQTDCYHQKACSCNRTVVLPSEVLTNITPAGKSLLFGTNWIFELGLWTCKKFEYSEKNWKSVFKKSHYPGQMTEDAHTEHSYVFSKPENIGKKFSLVSLFVENEAFIPSMHLIMFFASRNCELIFL